MANAEKQATKATADLNNAEFEKQMADAQLEIEKVDSPEFKKQKAQIQEKVKAAMQSLKEQQGEGTQHNVK